MRTCFHVQAPERLALALASAAIAEVPALDRAAAWAVHGLALARALRAAQPWRGARHVGRMRRALAAAA